MTFGRRTTEYREKREADKAANMRVLCIPSRTLYSPTYEGGVSGEGVEKPVEHRNPRLLAMARGKPCLLRIPGVCNNDPETTVACHSNQSKHGKSGARKADDQYSTQGCSACHEWLDRGPAPYEVKVMAFDLAHADQIEHWKEVASERGNGHDKRAADWALMLVEVPGGELA